MHLIESKVLYLQNYSKIQPRRHSSKKDTQTLHFNQSSSFLKSNYKNRRQIKSIDSPSNKLFIEPISIRIPKILQPIYRKQRQILFKITKQVKNRYSSKKNYTVSFDDEVAFEKHPIAKVDSIQVASMKPIDRLFHKMQNLRIAQNLLLAKPTNDISRKSQCKFYEQQSVYKSNITKLSSSYHYDRHSYLNRNKWKS